MEWTPITGFDDYLISRDGMARSTKRDAEILLRVRQLPNGYLRYCLYRNGRPHHVLVHRVVWENFVGPISRGLQINHRNGNKLDNRLENLEVVTPSENIRHNYAALGQLAKKGEDNNLSVLKEQDIPKIRALYESGKLQREIAEQFNVTRNAISSITRGRTWKHVP